MPLPLLIPQVLSSLASTGVDVSRARAIFVPGRIEFLGKHTDYCGGRSLLCAVEQGIAFAYVARRDNLVRILHCATSSRVEFNIDADLIPRKAHFSNYLMTVARRVARNFPGDLHGIDLAFHANLPPAAGLSSSSALIVGMFMMLADVNSLEHRPEYQAAIVNREGLAGYLGAIENGQGFQSGAALLAGDRGVGTLGGSQDHTAILCSAPGRLQQYGFCPVRHEGGVPLPEGYRFVIASSGITAEKTGAAQSAYNRNPLMVRQLLSLWNSATRRSDVSLAAAIRSNPSAADQLRDIVTGNTGNEFSAPILLDRLKQFIEESERIIPAAANALRKGDLAELGYLVDESQRLAERGLGNQVRQTTFLAAAAREAGAVAASAFGAGFGGSVWALVRDEETADFRERWLARYRDVFPEDAGPASVFVTRAGQPARQVNPSATEV